MDHKSDEDGTVEQCAWLEALINKQANDKSVARVIKVEVKGAVPEGINYASIISRAKLTVILRNGQKSQLSLIIKKAHHDEAKSKAIEEMNVFKSEIAVYTNVLKKFDCLMDEYQDTNEKPWCKMIGCIPNHTLVFEDLSVRKFVVADKVASLDYNHAALVLNNLGHFHALGKVLLNKGLISKGDTSPYYLEIDSTAFVNFFEVGFETCSKVIDEFWSDEWKEIGNSIKKQSKISKSKIKELLQKFRDDESSFITFCHGDCWTCNMMFKYCPYDSSYPIEHKFLDFQCCHINCYIFDVVQFLFTSVRQEVRSKQLKDLLNIYLKSLKSTLAIYDLENEAPTMARIETDYKNLLYYCFTISCIMVPIVKADIKEAFKLELLTDDNQVKYAFNPEIYNTESYKSAVQSDLKEWFSQGVF